MGSITIIGAGLVGQTLACMLSTHHHVTVLESTPRSLRSSQTFDVRASAISQGSARILDQYDLWGALSQQATPIHRVHVSDQGHWFGSVIDRQQHHSDALGYICENQQLYQALATTLRQRGITIKQPVDVTSIAFSKRGATLSVANDADILTDLVIIADGARSTWRERLGIVSRYHHFQQVALVTTVGLDRPHDHVAYERFTRHGPLALLPLSSYQGRNRASVVWTQPMSKRSRLLAMSDEQCIHALQKELGYKAGRITHMGQRDAYPLSSVMSLEQVRPNLAVMGNAAHFLHPVAGQGFNLALRDAHALATALADADSPGDIQPLQRYERTRLPDQQRLAFLTEQMVSVFSTKDWPISIARQLGLLGLNTIPGAKTQWAKTLMGQRG